MNIRNFFNIPNVSNTIKHVIRNVRSIQACQNKNIVIFIGREEVGKSTTINSLLGVRFQDSERNQRVLEPVEGSTPQAPMGSDERIGLMCTVFPAVYKDPQEDIYYLDTQGFFGTDKDPDEVAAASILLDAAIKSAASVRIVFLEDFQQFSKGLTAITDTVNLLNRVILTDEAPIYCLFNRYLPSNASASDFYNASDDQQSNMINEELQSLATKLLNAADENANKLSQRIQSMTQAASSATDAITAIGQTIPELPSAIDDFKNAVSIVNTARAARIIYNNFQEGRYGNIDPRSEFSINNLKNVIMSLPLVEKRLLSFNCCDQKRANFSRNFEEILRNHISPLVRDICFILKYPTSLVEHKIEEQRRELERNQALLTNVNNGIEVDLEEIAQELKNREIELNNLISELEQNKIRINQDIDRILNADPVDIRDYPFNEPLGFFKHWRTKVIKYDEPIPFVGIDQNLNEGTFCQKLINFDPSKFDIRKIDDNRTIFDLKDKTKPVYNFEVEYSSANTEGKARIIGTYILNGVVGGILGYFNMAPLVIPAVKVVSKLAGNTYPCIGVVTFYVRYQDKEKESLDKLKNDKSNIDELLSTRKEELKQVSLVITENLKEILTNNINNSENNLRKLDEILNFVQNITERWNARNEEDEVFSTVRDQFSAYNEISKMLYSSSAQNESVRDFENLFERLNNTTSESDDITCIQLINSYNVKNII